MRTFPATFIALCMMLPITAGEPAPMPGDRAAPPADDGKRRLELPVKNLLATDPNAALQPLLIAPSDPPGAEMPAQRMDFAPKTNIEFSTKRILGNSALVEAAPEPAQIQLDPVPAVERLDRRKGFIERPVKELVVLNRGEGPPAEAELPQPESNPAVEEAKSPEGVENVQLDEVIVTDEVENPHVEPGKVNWHDDFASACKASKDSGKPVFLFHLMGQLDQRFT